MTAGALSHVIRQVLVKTLGAVAIAKIAQQLSHRSGAVAESTMRSTPTRIMDAALQRVRKHARAVRAFHTGLVSETQRHLHVLRACQRHIDVLRQEESQPREKLASAEASCRQLRQLEQLKAPWRETYRDLRSSLRRLRAVLRQIVKPARHKARG